jgi:hypothetical protein
VCLDLVDFAVHLLGHFPPPFFALHGSQQLLHVSHLFNFSSFLIKPNLSRSAYEVALFITPGFLATITAFL